MLHAIGELDEAEELLSEALAGRKAALASSSTSTSLNDMLFNSMALATVLNAKGGDVREKEARELVQRAVAECRSALGDEHPTTQRALSLLASFLPKPSATAMPTSTPSSLKIVRQQGSSF